MKKFNIFNESVKNLGSFKDHRGTIHDIFYQANLHHVALIDSVAFAERGNHYHAKSKQHIFIVSGSLEYWFKNDSMPMSEFVVCLPGDLVTSEQNEIHALKIGEFGCKFIAFTEGVRGGEDYESDTFRVDNIMRSG